MTILSPHWHLRNRLFNEEAAQIQPGGYVFLGNSLTEQFDLSGYFPGLPVINRGISGDHIDGLLKRIDTSVLLLQPSRLFIMIGINDIGDGKSNDYILGLYTRLIRVLTEECRAVIYIQSLLPTGPQISQCPPQQIKQLNDSLNKLAADDGLIYVDLYPHFIKKAPWMDPALTGDGLHLNRAGYELWTNLLKNYMF